MTEDDYARDEWLSELYAEHAEEAISDFKQERLQSFYLANPLLAEPPAWALAEARKLLAEHPSAAYIFSAISIEVVIKVALLKPVVYGLVHSESAAGMIAELVAQLNRPDQFGGLLFEILSEHGGVDLRAFRRPEATALLWNEVQSIRRRRNALLHEALPAVEDEAAKSIAVASSLLDDVFPRVLRKLRLHLHGSAICADNNCKAKRAEFENLIAQRR